MLVAARLPTDRRIPVVLDAVGVGATPASHAQAERLLASARSDVLKDGGEIATLAGVSAEVRGVESIRVGGELGDRGARAGEEVRRTVVVVSGRRTS